MNLDKIKLPLCPNIIFCTGCICLSDVYKLLIKINMTYLGGHYVMRFLKT